MPENRVKQRQNKRDNYHRNAEMIRTVPANHKPVQKVSHLKIIAPFAMHSYLYIALNRLFKAFYSEF